MEGVNVYVLFQCDIRDQTAGRCTAIVTVSLDQLNEAVFGGCAFLPCLVIALGLSFCSGLVLVGYLAVGTGNKFNQKVTYIGQLTGIIVAALLESLFALSGGLIMKLFSDDPEEILTFIENGGIVTGKENG